MAEWLVSRRGGGVPTSTSQARRWVLVTLWRKPQWPASQLQEGDGVAVFDSRPNARRTLFHGTVRDLVTAEYETVEDVRGLLRRTFPSGGYTLPGRVPEPGWLIACDFGDVDWIDKGPVDVRLTAFRGGRTGWADLTGVPAHTAELLGLRR